jgi:hypothetical protein
MPPETPLNALAPGPAGLATKADRLAVILIQRTGSPALILIKWPPKPTVVDQVKYRPRSPQSLSLGRSPDRVRRATLRGRHQGMTERMPRATPTGPSGHRVVRLRFRPRKADHLGLSRRLLGD